MKPIVKACSIEEVYKPSKNKLKAVPQSVYVLKSLKKAFGAEAAPGDGGSVVSFQQNYSWTQKTVMVINTAYYLVLAALLLISFHGSFIRIFPEERLLERISFQRIFGLRRFTLIFISLCLMAIAASVRINCVGPLLDKSFINRALIIFIVADFIISTCGFALGSAIRRRF